LLFLQQQRIEQQKFLANQRALRLPPSSGMSSARQFEELVCWQRIHELKTEVGQATAYGSAGVDAVFRDQIVNAADRAERHIEEGFRRCAPLVFANFLDFSRTAACEIRSLLRTGVARGLFSADQFDRLDKLAAQGLRAVVHFQRFLRSPAAKRNVTGRYQRPYTAPVSNAHNGPDSSAGT
jgi:four helix bundle protein